MSLIMPKGISLQDTFGYMNHVIYCKTMGEGREVGAKKAGSGLFQQNHPQNCPDLLLISVKKRMSNGK
jgi:hypothetical protein